MADSSFLPPNLAYHAQAIASGLGVSPAIHPADYIFRWHYDDANAADKIAVLRNYFAGGKSMSAEAAPAAPAEKPAEK